MDNEQLETKGETNSEWIHQLTAATFDLGVDFPADAFPIALAEIVQAQLLEMYLIPTPWHSVALTVSGTRSFNVELDGINNTEQ